MFKQTIVATLLAVPSALAHGGVLSISNAGNWYWGWQPYNTPTGQTSIERPWSSYNPITNASDPTLACNDNGLAPSTGQQTATMAAGSSVTAYWNQVWPHNTGPMLMYLASCGSGSCNSVDSSKAQWFKIFEAGLISGSIYNGTWAAGEMIAQNSSWTFTLPSTVPSGNYLLRMETIALHSMPAQFYPECVQITITGGGSLQPTAAELVTFPGGYTNNDPGTNIDIYSNEAQTTFDYIIPGPPLYGSSSTSTCSGQCSSVSASNPAGGSTSTSGSTSSTSTSASKTSSTTVSSPSSTPTGATAAHYGQCGGQGWTGPTVCAAPYTCQATNQYYSQCL